MKFQLFFRVFKSSIRTALKPGYHTDDFHLDSSVLHGKEIGPSTPPHPLVMWHAADTDTQPGLNAGAVYLRAVTRRCLMTVTNILVPLQEVIC